MNEEIEKIWCKEVFQNIKKGKYNGYISGKDGQYHDFKNVNITKVDVYRYLCIMNDNNNKEDCIPMIGFLLYEENNIIDKIVTLI